MAYEKSVISLDEMSNSCAYAPLKREFVELIHKNAKRSNDVVVFVTCV